MADFRELGTIGEAFVAAAMDSALWNAAMDVAARATGSTGAVLVKGALRSFPRSESIQRAAEAYVNDAAKMPSGGRRASSHASAVWGRNNRNL